MAELKDILDALGYLRYGKSTADKEGFARSTVAPYLKDNSASQSKSDRTASGYLFTREHPEIQEKLQPWVDAARIGWFGDTPEEQSYATLGANLAKTKKFEK